MTIKVCDICYQQRDDNSSFLRKITKSTYRISYKKPKTGERLALDVCEDHSNFFKTPDIKSYDDAVAKYDKLLGKSPFSI